MNFNIFDEPQFAKTELGRKTRFWFYRLLDKLVSLYEWKNLPDTINRDYLETVLMTQGSIIWLKDKSDNLRALYGAYYGYDCYMFPTQAEIANPVLGTLKGTFDKDAVWMRNNKFASPAINIINEYAQNLAQLDVDLKVNLDNLKLSKIFVVSSQEEGKQVRDIYKRILSGEPGLIIKNNLDLTSDGKVDVFSQDVQYLGTQFLTDRRTQINDFLTQFGINNIALEKKERLITDEATSNNQELEINKEFWLSTRREAAEKINEIFGTNITVDIIKDIPDEIYEAEQNGEGDDNNDNE